MKQLYKLDLPCFYEHNVKRLYKLLTDLEQDLPKSRIVTFYNIEFIDEFEYNGITFTVVGSANQKFICGIRKNVIEANLDLLYNN